MSAATTSRFTATATGEAGSRRRDRAPDRPGHGDRQRAADTEARPARLPSTSSTCTTRSSASDLDPARDCADAPCCRRSSSTTRTGSWARGRAASCSRPTSTPVAPALIRAADRILRPQPRSRPLGLHQPRPRTDARSPDRDAVNGVDTRRLPRPGPTGPPASGSGDPEDGGRALSPSTPDRQGPPLAVDVAIEALARTRNRDIHPIVAGGGSCSTASDRRPSCAAGIGGRVHFLDRVPTASCRTCCAVLRVGPVRAGRPSLAGIVRHRSDRGMACGLPAVATDYPGVRAVLDAETGFSAPPGDSAAVAEALDRLDDMGADGRADRPPAARRRCASGLAGAARSDGSAAAEAIEARNAKLGVAA
ncbi:MAG: glycosyltransferase family 4 protein [Solirubrobacterales bacterium]